MHHGIDEFVNGFGQGVEGGHCGQDDAASEGDGAHVFDVDEVEGRVAHHADELPALFEDHVGGAGDEVVGKAAGDAAQGAH